MLWKTHTNICSPPAENYYCNSPLSSSHSASFYLFVAHFRPCLPRQCYGNWMIDRTIDEGTGCSFSFPFLRLTFPLTWLLSVPLLSKNYLFAWRQPCGWPCPPMLKVGHLVKMNNQLTEETHTCSHMLL